jgi:hypothetical protein
MHGIVLVELGIVLDFAHHDDDGGGAGEDGVAGAPVTLPGIDKVRDALLEELAVDLDIRHVRAGCSSRVRATEEGSKAAAKIGGDPQLMEMRSVPRVSHGTIWKVGRLREA